ncbi:ABC transporter ATP-binding protein [Marinicrinis sediminis]|uniref:ABC transporter ATP-binding protein n=1 Tax=Marinicrinis sediminis TaxID=1652465 RepID=A0ABW5RDH0_9BACL
MIHFKDVSLIREQRTILSDIQLDIRQGEQWMILGRNGSGKTTILEMINGYLFPTRGQVHVLGERYGQTDVREVRKRIGYISPSLIEKLHLSDPVWEVAATGLFGYLRFYQTIPPEVEEEAVQMLDRFKIAHLRHSPLGVLSQGERKKVMLARAMLSKPELLILDEPCAGLDLYEREKLLQDLTMLAEQGMPMVYVSHHIEELMPFFTHVCIIEQGKIAAAGPKHDVIRPEQFADIFDVKVQLSWEAGRPWIHVV